MAKEDIINKDYINELKDLQDENTYDSLEPVNIIVGRFQPLHKGHLQMSKELKKENGLPSVYIYIRSKSGKNSQFTDRTTINFMEDVVQKNPDVRDTWSMQSSFIPILIKESQRRGYDPVLIGAGSDRAKDYKRIANRMTDVTTHPDFDIFEIKSRLTSATKVRNAIKDGDEKLFKKLTTKEIHPYYKTFQKELEDKSVVAESIDSLVENYDLDITKIEDLLFEYDLELYSNIDLVESVLEYHTNKIEEMAPEENIQNAMENMSEAKEGDILTHKHDSNITIELIEPTNRGWKVTQSTKKGSKVKSKIAFFHKQDISGEKALFESMNEGKTIKFKEDYPVYHHSFGSALDGITNYVDAAGYKIDDNEFFTAFGDAFFKPKKGKTLRKSVELLDKNGNVLGNLHVQIYNRGTEGNAYELNVYTDQTRRGLKESNDFASKVSNGSTLEVTNELIKESFGDDGVMVFEHLLSIHNNAIEKSHSRVFERAIMFRNAEITVNELDNKAEREVIPFLAKLDETKLVKFRDTLNEMTVSPDYEAKIDAAVCLIIKTNRPVGWEGFKYSMVRSDFYKKEFKPFLMLQGLSDYQIERFAENILRVKYQHYINYFTGSVGLSYTINP